MIFRRTEVYLAYLSMKVWNRDLALRFKISSCLILPEINVYLLFREALLERPTVLPTIPKNLHFKILLLSYTISKLP